MKAVWASASRGVLRDAIAGVVAGVVAGFAGFPGFAGFADSTTGFLVAFFCTCSPERASQTSANFTLGSMMPSW